MQSPYIPKFHSIPPTHTAHPIHPPPTPFYQIGNGQTGLYSNKSRKGHGPSIAPRVQGNLVSLLVTHWSCVRKSMHHSDNPIGLGMLYICKPGLPMVSSIPPIYNPPATHPHHPIHPYTPFHPHTYSTSSTNLPPIHPPTQPTQSTPPTPIPPNKKWSDWLMFEGIEEVT